MNTERTLYSQNDFRNYSELYHHGVLGQKWGKKQGPPYPLDASDHSAAEKKAGWKESLDKPKGINNKARDKQIKSINKMYDRANKWTDRKIEKLDAKGKTAKADVWRYAKEQNEKSRKEKINALNEMTTSKELRKSKNQDSMDALFGGQEHMKANSANMTTLLSRVNEYDMQRGARWMSNFTRESTLARMTPEEGYEYLRNKVSSERARQRANSRNSNYNR